MTIIVMCKDKEGFVLGCDSQETSGNLVGSVAAPKIVTKTIKTIKNNDGEIIKTENIYLGVTGYGRVLHYITHNFDFCDKYDDETYDKYLYRGLKKLKEELQEYGLVKEKDKINDVGAYFLILLNNNMYYVDENLGIVMISGEYYTVGCGDELALGSLYSTKNIKNVEERVLMALKSAKHHDAYCGEDLQLIKVNKDGETV